VPGAEGHSHVGETIAIQVNLSPDPFMPPGFTTLIAFSECICLHGAAAIISALIPDVIT